MDLDSMIYGNVESDDDLMAELLELAGEDKPKPPPTRSNPTARAAQQSTNAKPLDIKKIENLAKQMSVEDEDIGEDDGDLLDELNDLVDDEEPEPEISKPTAIPPSEPKVVSESPVSEPPTVPPRRDLPPAPAPKPQVPHAPKIDLAQPSTPAVAESNILSDAKVLPLKEALEQRLAVYKESVQKAEKNGDDRKARQNQRICKQFEDALKAVARGKPVDVESLPKPVGCAEIAGVSNVVHPPPQIGTHVPISQSNPQAAQLKVRALQAKKEGRLEEAKQLLIKAKQLETGSPTEPTPKPQAVVLPQARRRSTSSERTVTPIKDKSSPMDLLKEREKFFKNLLQKSQETNDERRVRQCRRILASYSEAITAYRKGAQYDYSSLPPPPGKDALNNATFLIRPDPSMSTHGATPPKQAKSRQQEQLDFLLHRQQQFKEAAIVCKQRGDMETAKHYLKQMKGFDPMIEASRNGLPVNITETPIPPQARTSSSSLKPQIMTNPEALASSSSVAQKRDEVLSTLEGDLIRQIQMCDQNQEYFTKAGSVSDVRMFEQMALDTKRDLLTLRNAVARGDRLPGFHYETKELPVLRYNADLAEDELELTIVRVLTATLPEGYAPEHADIYVTWELGYPDDNPQKGTTKRVASTTSPAFHDRCKLRISFGAKQFQRLVKRHGLKFEVWQKTGFMRSDKSLGTSELKLLPIETECTLHESLDLLQGRKPIGGKLEIKVRVRRPMLKNDAKKITQKWLILDPPQAGQQPRPNAQMKIPRAVFKNRLQTNV